MSLIYIYKCLLYIYNYLYRRPKFSLTFIKVSYDFMWRGFRSLYPFGSETAYKVMVSTCKQIEHSYGCWFGLKGMIQVVILKEIPEFTERAAR